MCTGHMPHKQTWLMVICLLTLWERWLDCWSGASRTDMHTGRCCYKMDTCCTVATQSSCLSFVTQSCMSAGVVLLYLPYLLVWCLTISRVCWCDASLKAILSGVKPNYQLCQLVRCLIIGHAFWCGASLLDWYQTSK